MSHQAPPPSPVDRCPYACPETSAPLVRTGTVFRSTKTGQLYPIRNGTPIFLRHKPIEDGATSRTLARLLHDGRRDGWEAALREIDPEGLAYVTDEERARYLDILPINKDSIVLEIGASKGQHTHLIAARCAFVCGLEVVLDQAMFAAMRCAQMGRQNVSIAVGGDDCRLPYLSGSFDVVIINLVIEWCAGRDPTEETAALQQRLVTESRRVLRPGGCLFVATKNRFNVRLLTGGVDEHCGLRFGHALPRWLMRSLLKRRGCDGPTGLLHSFRALRRLLMRAGFAHPDAYWAVPDARHPAAYVPLERSSVIAAKRNVAISRLQSRRTRLLLRAAPFWLLPWITPSLVFVARTAEDQGADT